MKKTKYILILFSLVSAISVQAATFTYAASTANNLSGFNGADLLTDDLVEIGTYDAPSGTFNSLASGVSDNDGGPGYFAHQTGRFDTDGLGLKGQQIAMRWSEAASGLSAIIYFDINGGGDAATTANWTVRGGDGSGIDTLINQVEVADLTTLTYDALRPQAVLIGAKLGGLNADGYLSFEIIPEASTYALGFGLFALGWVAFHRRRK
jgi:hypothetical protein